MSAFKHHINQNQQQTQTQQPTMAQMYDIIKSDGLESTFPNTEVAARIHLTLIPIKCTGERSFSKMKIIKNHFRSCMLQPRINDLSIQSDLLDFEVFSCKIVWHAGLLFSTVDADFTVL